MCHREKVNWKMSANQPTSIILENALVCDDVRHEVGGVKTLVGVRDGNFEMPKEGFLKITTAIWIRLACTNGERLMGKVKLQCYPKNNDHKIIPVIIPRPTRFQESDNWIAEFSIRWNNDFLTGHAGKFYLRWFDSLNDEGIDLIKLNVSKYSKEKET